jgi:hypothetical protein
VTGCFKLRFRDRPFYKSIFVPTAENFARYFIGVGCTEKPHTCTMFGEWRVSTSAVYREAFPYVITEEHLFTFLLRTLKYDSDVGMSSVWRHLPTNGAKYLLIRLVT